MEKQEKTKRFRLDWGDRKLILLIILVGLIIIGAVTLKVTSKSEENVTTYASFSALRGVTELVILKQEADVTVYDTVKETKLWGAVTFSSENTTTAKASIYLYLNLADSLETTFRDVGDRIEIIAPLYRSEPAIDITTLHEIENQSINRWVTVDKMKVRKRLQQEALARNLPTMIETARKEIMATEKVLENIAGKPVKIILKKQTPLVQVTIPLN